MSMLPHSTQPLFSTRHGYAAPDREITIREDAPEDLRFAVPQIARDLGIWPSDMRDIVCQVLLVAPDRGNWSEYPNIWGEVNNLLSNCEWYRVYDIAEKFYSALSLSDPGNAAEYEARLNDYFRERGIGWQMQSGAIVVRGSEPFEAATQHAARTLWEDGKRTAANEIHEALQDLSRRPQADISGAIQHAMAALECTAREVAGGSNDTLGSLLKQRAAAIGIRPPLDDALSKLWGYSSVEGRHLREGRDPRFEEAELVVSVAAAVSVYLSRKSKGCRSDLAAQIR